MVGIVILFIKHGFTPIGTAPYAYTSRFYHTAKGPIDGLKISTSGRVWYSKSPMISTWFSLGVGNSTFGNAKPSRIFLGQNSHFQGFLRLTPSPLGLKNPHHWRVGVHYQKPNLTHTENSKIIMYKLKIRGNWKPKHKKNSPSSSISVLPNVPRWLG